MIPEGGEWSGLEQDKFDNLGGGDDSTTLNNEKDYRAVTA